MPSIKSQVEKNAERIAQGGDLVHAAGPSNNAANPTPMPPPPPVTGLPVRGYYPQGMTLDQDFGGTSQITRTGPNMRSPTFPKQPGIVSTIISKATAAVSSAASSLIIKVNNMLSPNQSVLNLLQGTGMTITVDANGNVVFVSTATGDGLTHSAAPWESDPAYISLRDDFTRHGNTFTGTATSLNIGELNWALFGAVIGGGSGLVGSTPPNLGVFGWVNTISQNEGQVLLPPGPGTGLSVGVGTGYMPNAWALAENPGMQLTWVFRLEPLASTSTFSTAKKSIYVGLGGTSILSSTYAAVTSNTRPDIFCGVRFDTSPQLGSFALTSVAAGTGVYQGTITGGAANAFVGRLFTVTGFSNSANNGTFLCIATSSATQLTLDNPNSVLETKAAAAISPGIADSFYTLEMVANQTNYSNGAVSARNNTQGTTLVTTLAPTNDGFHRLDIIMSAAGQVTITLDGSSTNTLTAAIPTVSFTTAAAGGNGILTNDNAAVSWTIGTRGINSPVNPFAGGSSVTVSGFTSTHAPLNGTFTLYQANNSTLYYNVTNANIGSGNNTLTISGYPAFVPMISFGNDDELSPAQNLNFQVDFFSFIWNPNLGPKAPGTPSSTLPRYW